MLKRIFLILFILPFLGTCQQNDTITLFDEELIVQEVEFQDKFTKKKYSVTSSIEIAQHVESYFLFLEKHNLDVDPMKRLAGVFVTKNISYIAQGRTPIGTTKPAVDSLNVSAAVYLDKQFIHESDSIYQKVLVWHEMTHAYTNAGIPHCKDYVNCSPIMYPSLFPVMGRIIFNPEKAEYQLANMIRTFNMFPPTFNYLGIKEEDNEN